MKKIYVLFGAFLFTGGLMAQSAQLNSATHPHLIPTSLPKLRKVDNSAVARTSSNQSVQTSYHAYVSHTDAAINAVDPGNASQTFTLFVDPMFQDSSVQTIFSNGTSYVTVQKSGGMVDPKSTILPMYLNSTTAYTIDTVWIAGFYNIIPAHAAAGDTLQVELTWGLNSPAPAYFEPLQITGPPQQLFTMPYNTTSLAMGNKSFSTAPVANKVTLHYILTVADTVSTANNPNDQQFHYVAVVPVSPISIPANNIVAVQFTYAPASAYAANAIYYDAVNSTQTMNSFLPYIWEQTGLNASNGQSYFYDATSRGISGELGSESRYGTWPVADAFLNGCMLPFTDDGYVWGVSISASTFVGMNNQLVENGFSLEQNIPNPASNGNTLINYNIVDAANVSFDVFDVSGKKVMSVDQGHQAAGSYQLNLNTRNLNAGVYFYSINVDGKRITKRMVISE